MHDILNRLQRTLESKLLQKYTLCAIGSFVLAAFGLNLVQATFDPGLVNSAGDYAGDPPRLIFGIIATLIGTGGVFYFYAKWSSGAVVNRAATLLEQASTTISPAPEASRAFLAVQKLNTPGHDTEFYSHVIKHYIDHERQKLMDHDSSSELMKLVSNIASFHSTHAYLTESIHQTEYDLITWASQQSQNPSSPESRTSILARLDIVR
jgi:hypothetical protein